MAQEIKKQEAGGANVPRYRDPFAECEQKWIAYSTAFSGEACSVGRACSAGLRRPPQVERSYGSFERSFRLPDSTDEAQIKADFNKGVLRIVVPKRAEAVKSEKKIPIGKG